MLIVLKDITTVKILNSNIQKEFCEGPENEKWLNYPLIKEWDILIDILSDIRDEKHKSEEYCPICRSKN